MLRRACGQYGNTRWSIVRSHSRTWVAALNGYSATLLRALHKPSGATFSNSAQRGSYDSEARAVMTLGELERRLTEYIVGGAV
jgi:hypothetical protein